MAFLHSVWGAGEVLEIHSHYVRIRYVGLLGWLRRLGRGKSGPRVFSYVDLSGVEFYPASMWQQSGFVHFRRSGVSPISTRSQLSGRDDVFLFWGSSKNRILSEYCAFFLNKIGPAAEIAGSRTPAASPQKEPSTTFAERLAEHNGRVSLSMGDYRRMSINQQKKARRAAARNEARAAAKIAALSPAPAPVALSVSPSLPDPKPKARARNTPAAVPKSKSRSKVLAHLEFDYLNLEGEYGRRRVDIYAVNRERCEGHCHVARGVRTFVFERVQSKVLDLDTGELAYAKPYFADLLERTGGGYFLETPVPKPKPQSTKKDAICFSGFRSARRDQLEELAAEAGFYVAAGVTKDLRYLVAGSNVGPKKKIDAEDVGASVIDEAEFLALVGA